ncbi:MAG: peptidoglycan DD-metalloendopeptidase family protein [Acidobacteriota bacterium]|nr:peptidoglycan DD-metalloendopeptidase family protein [Acidobacteriota bacterium]
MNPDEPFLREVQPRDPGHPSGRPPKIIWVAVVGVLAAAAIFLFLPRGAGQGSFSPAIPFPTHPAPPAPVIEAISLGTTLSDILALHGFSEVEANSFYEEVKPVFDLRKVMADRTMRFFKDEAGTVQAIEYDVDDRRYLRVDRIGNRFLPGIISYRFEVRQALAAGTIEDILINALKKQGEKEVLALKMAELFAWDIDFNTELRVGDSFRLVFEKNFREGAFAGYGEILAAEFVCQGKAYEAFRFVYPDTKEADHFDAAGKSVRKEFLRSPLPYAAPITSRFTSSRFHPIYKVYRAHYGVDFGAPIGTPVRATGDGLVESAGWMGGAGRAVKVRHANGYVTTYMHLSRILVERGRRVRMGQTIGRVGSSGASTGPHLDYRIQQNGAYINPLGRRFNPVAPLRTQYTEAFAREVAKLRALLKPAN